MCMGVSEEVAVKMYLILPHEAWRLTGYICSHIHDVMER